MWPVGEESTVGAGDVKEVESGKSESGCSLY